MTRRIRITAPAEAEVAEVRHWYDAYGVELGIRFDDTLHAALHKALDAPRLYPVVAGKTRKIRLGHLPYIAYFLEESGGIVVSAVLHERRDPAIWRSRL